MADKRINVTKCDDQWDISYEVEKNSLKNTFCVVVKFSDMVDPTSETEAKTLADAQASLIKDAWAAEAPVATVISTEPENVTL